MWVMIINESMVVEQVMWEVQKNLASESDRVKLWLKSHHDELDDLREIT